MSKLNLACKITAGRLLGVPVFILLLNYYILGLQNDNANEHQRIAALIVFILLAASDALDGFIARARHEISRLGKILDPLADKALLVSSLILLTRPTIPELQPQIPVALTLLVLSRDALLIIGATVIHHVTGRVEIRPRWSGKLSTTFLMLTIVMALASAPTNIFNPTIWATALFVGISVVHYLVDGLKQLEETNGNGNT